MCEGMKTKLTKEWEHTRAIVYVIAAVNRDPKKSFPTIEKFMPLSTDDVTDEDSEAKRLKAHLKKYRDSKKQKE